MLIQAELAEKDAQYLKTNNETQAAMGTSLNEAAAVIQGLENDLSEIKVS